MKMMQKNRNKVGSSNVSVVKYLSVHVISVQVCLFPKQSINDFLYFTFVLDRGN